MQVIAFAGIVMQNTTIQWEEEYFMGAASKGPITGGAYHYLESNHKSNWLYHRTAA